MRSLILLLLTTAISHAAGSSEKIEDVYGLLRDRKLSEAEHAVNALIAANPAEAEAHALLGSVRVAKGDADGAVKACEKAVELAPKNSEHQRRLGDAYFLAAQKAGLLSRMGWAKKCGASYERAVEFDPTNLNARSSLMDYYWMLPRIMGGGLDKASQQADAIKKLDVSRDRIAYAMLNTYEKKFAEAFTEFDEILKAAPDNYLALFQFGRLTALTGEHIDRGMEALKKCLTLSPTEGSPGHDAAHWSLGNLWERKGDKKAARVAYEATLAINPSYQPAIDSLKKLN